jgi:hypothetical protein
MRERGLRSPGEVTGAGDLRSGQDYANRQEILEPFGYSSLRDPEPAAAEAENCGDERPALGLGVERREHLLGRVELALLDERLDQQRTIQDAVHRWCWELGRSKRHPRVSLSGGQIAASEREPAAVGQTHGKPTAVARHPRLLD